MDNNQTFLNACRNGQKSIVQIFLKKGGIDINKRDQEGNTALYYACQKGYRDIVALLLDNDADASCINNRSESPLHARINSVGKIIKKLLLKFPVIFLPLPSHNLYTPYSATKLTMAK